MPAWVEEEGTTVLPGLGCRIGVGETGVGGPGATAPGPTGLAPAGKGAVILGSRLVYYKKFVSYTS